jgi:hypothetical protein
MCTNGLTQETLAKNLQQLFGVSLAPLEGVAAPENVEFSGTAHELLDHLGLRVDSSGAGK